jgi:predicted NAD/FAD-binding protein
MVARVSGGVRTGSPVVRVDRGSAGVAVATGDGRVETYDEVVLACHGDQVLPLVGAPSVVEQMIFRSFQTTRNEAVLHTDTSFLPRRPAARASWNYELGPVADAPPTVTYHLNRLQRLTSRRQFCVTLNPRRPVRADAVLARMVYAHPQYSRAAVAAQSRWAEVSGFDRIHYCGAYWFYGFHEDGVRSALRVAEALGAGW